MPLVPNVNVENAPKYIRKTSRVLSLNNFLAAMNMTNIMPQMLAIQAAVTKKREDVYYAAMMDPHTAAELSLDDIKALCDELIEAHNNTEFKVLW